MATPTRIDDTHAHLRTAGRLDDLGARAVAAAASIVDPLFAEAAEVDDGGAPLRSLALLGERGLLAAPLSVEPDGASLIDDECRLDLLRVLAHVGRGSLPVGRLYEGHVNALALIARFGTPAQRTRAARDAADGRLFAVWNTEAPPGVRLDETAAPTLRGAKTFASGAGIVARAIVTARLAGGAQQMILVDTETTPLSIDPSFWQPLGMRPTASYRVDLDGVLVAADAHIGQPGDYTREPTFSSGAVRFAAVQMGGVEAVFDETRHFLRAHGRSDDPYQRSRLGEMAMLVASGRQWLAGAALNAPSPMLDAAALPATPSRDAAMAARQQAGHEPGIAYANLMRSAIEDIALRVMQLAERSVGARGLLRPEPFERLHRDLTHYLRQAAPDAAIARAGAHVLARSEAAHDLWNE